MICHSLCSECRKHIIKQWHRWFLVALLIVFPFFFVGGPDYEGPRSLKELWNLGHFFFFAMLVLVFDSTWRSSGRLVPSRIVVTLLMLVFLGLGIEILQLYTVDRSFSWTDIARDLSGGMVVLLFAVCRSLSSLQASLLRWLLVTIVFINFFPFASCLYDEYRSYRDFPLLAGFEGEAELSRWEKNGVTVSLSDTQRVQGNYSAKITLNTDQYSGVSLKYFPGDWSGYRGLAFNVFNPGHPVTIHYRGHDNQHHGDLQLYNNRYNNRTVLAYGWNEIVIPFSEIIEGPKGRKMDLANIRGFGIFVIKQDNKRVLYLDNVHLF